jgi:hypothetical protein
MSKTKKTPATKAGARKKKKRSVIVQALADAITSARNPKPKRAPKADTSVRDTMLAAFEAWKGGKQISVIAGEVGVKRSKLRRNFIQIAGDKAEFQKLRQAGAGGSVEPFGGKRATGGRVVGSISVDDSKVPRIASAKASEGWSVRRVWRPRLVEIKEGREVLGTTEARELVAEVHIAPTGEEYVDALPSEPADLIYTRTEPFAMTRRFRLYSESKLAKRIDKEGRREEKTVERGEVALERTRERKRKQKEARKRA